MVHEIDFFPIQIMEGHMERKLVYEMDSTYSLGFRATASSISQSFMKTGSYYGAYSCLY